MSASIHAPFVLVCCSGRNNYLIACWISKFAHSQTNEQSLFLWLFHFNGERENINTLQKRHKLSEIRILIPEQNTTSYLPTLVGKHSSQIFLVVCHQFCIHIGRHFGAHLYRNSLNPLVFLAAKWQPEHSAPSTDFSIGLRSGDCLTTPWLWVLLL